MHHPSSQRLQKYNLSLVHFKHEIFLSYGTINRNSLDHYVISTK